jgi:hypothetical protein
MFALTEAKALIIRHRDAVLAMIHKAVNAVIITRSSQARRNARGVTIAQLSNKTRRLLPFVFASQRELLSAMPDFVPDQVLHRHPAIPQPTAISAEHLRGFDLASCLIKADRTHNDGK